MTGFTENPALVLVLAFFIFFAAAAGVMVILWIALPFSVFGAKGLLTALIKEQEKTNVLLKELVKAQTGKEAGFSGVDYAEEDKKINSPVGVNRPQEETEVKRAGINEEVKTIDL